jgi:hypothetical protein
MLFGCWHTGEWDGRNPCHSYGGGSLKGFSGKTLKLTEGLKDLDVVGEIKLKWILKNIEWEKADWIYLGLDKDMASSFERGK